MSERMRGWLVRNVKDFGCACQVALSGPGEREAAIRGPVAALLRNVCDHWNIRMNLYEESPVDGHRAIADFAMTVDKVTSGHVEVKKPGTDIDSAALKGHNRRQWEHFKDLPNLLYTDGRSWALYRAGERVGDIVHLDGDPARAGNRLGIQDGRFEQLLWDFFTWRPVPIRTARQLVRTVAPLCRLLRDQVSNQLAYEAELHKTGQKEVGELPFAGLAEDWRHLLIPSADDSVFADHYAQAVTFGLLLARSEDIDLTGQRLHDIGDRLGHHHSVMGKALQILTGTVVSWFQDTLDLLVRVAAAVEWDDIHAERSDAYLYLYEDFLAVYDEKLRRASGSYYTPREVVTEMVRLVDAILRTRLDCPDGFRSPEVVTIDPAMGTGTFLHTIMERVAEQAADADGAGAVPQAVRDVATRLIGFDSQISPFAVAELRMSATMRRYAAPLPAEGLRLYVANTLDNPHSEDEWLPQSGEALSRSQREANKVKLDQRAMVVMGNPPYRERAKGHGLWVETDNPGDAPRLSEFRSREHPRTGYVLNNLYVYFWRWATWKLFNHHPDHAYGVVALISTAGYLRGPGFAGMREYLRRTCDEGWIIDFSPEGMRPEVSTRIFPGVQQPLVLGIFVRHRRPDPSRPARIRYLALNSERDKKYVQLTEVEIDSSHWQLVRDEWTAPFTPATGAGWDSYPALGDLMPWTVPGVKPNRTWVYAPAPSVLRRRWADLVNAPTLADREALFKQSRNHDRTIYSKVEPLPGGHRHNGTIADERGTPCPPPQRVAYRSFDRQYLIPDSRVMDRPRPELWRVAQVGTIFVNEQHAKPLRGGPGVVCTTLIPDTDHFKGSEGGRVLPMHHPAGLPNVAPRLLDLLGQRLAQPSPVPLALPVPVPVPVEDLVAYLAGVVAHPGFTTRFAAALVTPGIRLPITTDPALWTEAVSIGREVCWLHTYGDAFADSHAGRPSARDGRPSSPVRYPTGDPRQPLCRVTVEVTPLPTTISHDPATEALHVGSGVFAPVPTAVWQYEVGGMPVVRKWFSYRRADPGGRSSSRLDKHHVAEWDPTWNAELIDLLTLLRRLVELEPAQAELLDRIVAGPLLTVTDLTAAGVLPVPDIARRPHRETYDLLIPAPTTGRTHGQRATGA